MKKVIIVLILLPILCGNLFAQTFSDVQNEKTLEMFNALQIDNKNLFISPLSIRLALGIYYYGIKDEYHKEQWEQYLGISDSASKSAFNQVYDYSKQFFALIDAEMEKEKRSPIPKPSRVSNSKLEISNALKYRENIPLDSNYLNFLKDNLNVVLFPFEDDDSQVNTEISSWVLKNSNNKIQYLPEKDENAIINLIYFRGTWKYTFDNKYTKKRTFFTNNKIIRTETMYKKNPFSSYEDKKIHAVKLPYASCNMSVIILCPKKKRTSLNELDMDYWKSITNNLGGFYNIKLYLPKFSYSSSLIFDSDFWAQQGITDDYSSNQELYISTILHNTFIEMDEEKTEAWFITSAYRIGGRAKSKIVKANKPFLFFIVDDTSDLILFTGKYVGCK